MLDFVKRPFIIHKPFDDFFGEHKLEAVEIFSISNRIDTIFYTIRTYSLIT